MDNQGFKALTAQYAESICGQGRPNQCYLLRGGDGQPKCIKGTHLDLGSLFQSPNCEKKAIQSSSPSNHQLLSLKPKIKKKRKKKRKRIRKLEQKRRKTNG